MGREEADGEEQGVYGVDRKMVQGGTGFHFK